MRLDEQHHYEIEASGRTVRVTARIGPLRSLVATHQAASTGPLVLAAEVDAIETIRDARTGPDIVSLGIEETDGRFTTLAALDGKYLSTEVAGRFTGRVIGMCAGAGTVHFAWFDYEPGGR